MPVRRDGADFLHGVVVEHPVKEVVDLACGRLLERIVWVDVNHLAVPRKIRWSAVGGSMEHEGRGIGRTLSTDLLSEQSPSSVEPRSHRMLMRNPEDYFESICQIEVNAELRSLRAEATGQSCGRRFRGKGQCMP